ncbi:MAG: hypothetical protein FWE22_00045 [Firmicutes bacterium]|nr:hypothetical protein [Bacillota bacterium]
MKSAIRQMYYGEKGSSEQITPTKEYLKILQKIVEVENELTSKLVCFPELSKLYQNIIDLKEGKESEFGATCYAEGFKFGFTLGIETAE